MNTNKRDIIEAFNRNDKCINDNTNDILCLIEFYDNDSIAVFERTRGNFRPIHSCYLDGRNIIHISTNRVCSNLIKPERKYIESYNNSISSYGAKIRKVYFKDHVDSYRLRNSKLSIIRKFRHDNICINDVTGDMIRILGLVEFNDAFKDLYILHRYGLQHLAICYMDDKNNLHRCTPTSLLDSMDFCGRESIELYNNNVSSKFRIKKIYFQDHTEVFNV